MPEKMPTDFPNTPSRRGITDLPSTITSCLLRGVRETDQTAWERMVRLYHPMVYGWCSRSGLQPNVSSEVCQDISRSVASNIVHFRREQPGDTFRGRVRRVTQRRVYYHLQRLALPPETRSGVDAQMRCHEVVDALKDSPSSFHRERSTRGQGQLGFA